MSKQKPLNLTKKAALGNTVWQNNNISSVFKAYRLLMTDKSFQISKNARREELSTLSLQKLQKFLFFVAEAPGA